jgi:hypothetical protein
MAKQYRAILIEPETHSVTELQSDLTLPSIHDLVGTQDALGHFRVARYDDDMGGGYDFGWVDDNGLNRSKPVHAFLLSFSKDPVAGRCLVIGANRYGETCNARLPVDFLRADISWLGLILPEVTWDRTEHGERAIVTYSRVK